MKYKRIGTIKSIDEIPFNQPLILNGSIDELWLWRIKGEFKKKDKKVIFRDIHGCVHDVEKKIDLAILKRID